MSDGKECREIHSDASSWAQLSLTPADEYTASNDTPNQGNFMAAANRMPAAGVALGTTLCPKDWQKSVRVRGSMTFHYLSPEPWEFKGRCHCKLEGLG